MSKHNIILDLINGTSHRVSFLLKDDTQSTLSVMGIKLRKIIAPLLRLIYRTKTEYKIIIDSRVKLHRKRTGKIFAINHRQGDDIVIGANVVNQSAYIVFGNLYLALETSNGLGLWAYGTILLDRSSKESRNSAYEKMKYVLQNGGNVIIYPEGYWNLSDDGLSDERHGADAHNSVSWLMQDINVGIVRLAQEIGCEIVPTILHYDEIGKKRCYALRGKPIEILKSDNIWEKKNEIVEYMQTQYYLLMEKYSSYTRFEAERYRPLSEQWTHLKAQIVAMCDIPRINYKVDLSDEKKIGKAKVISPVVTVEEVYSHLKVIVPTINNAFLFNKRNHF